MADIRCREHLALYAQRSVEFSCSKEEFSLSFCNQPTYMPTMVPLVFTLCEMNWEMLTQS